MMELTEIYRPIKDDLAKVEEELKVQLQSEDKFVWLIGKYTLATEGKRLRPALVLLSSKFGQANQKKVINLATAVELIHTATLVHDDIIDKAILRRNEPSLNIRWGNDISILFGDYLYSKAFGLLSNLGAPKILYLVSSILDKICEGEIQQIKRCFDLNLTERDYLSIIKKKTANFLSICCQAGAVLGKAEPVKIRRLRKYGLNFGMAFQIVDDCLDLVGNEQEAGKSLGSDIRDGKLTLPFIHLFCSIKGKVKKEAIDLLKVKGSECRLKEMVEDHGSIDYAFQRSREYISQAERAIRPLKESPFKQSLLALADHVVRR